MKTFTLQYAKSYGIELLTELKAKAQKKADGEEEWQLLTRPEVSFSLEDLSSSSLQGMCV